MTATVTDLAEYRLRKQAEEWFDAREESDILRRIDILTWHRDDGWAAEGSPEYTLVFAQGYDPINHPEDNLDVVTHEARRRGII